LIRASGVGRGVRQGGKAALGIGIVLAATLALVAGVESRSDGTGVLAREGCTCHAPSPSDFAAVRIDAPTSFVGGARYTITVTVEAPLPRLPVAANLGGFALEVSAGELAVPEGALDVRASGALASHTSEGNDQRAWRVDWIAPLEGGEVTIVAAANAANGDGRSDALDLWNRAEVVVRGSPETPSQDPEPPPSADEEESPVLDEPPPAQKTPLPLFLALVALSLAASARRRA